MTRHRPVPALDEPIVKTKLMTQNDAHNNLKDASQPASTRILYMEDDPGLARLLKRKLELAGYVVDIAQDGGEGLAMYDATIHDVVVVDYKMPIFNGLDVLRILAEDASPPAVIMLTGSGDEQTAVQALKLGASDYIVKDLKRDYLERLPEVIEAAHRQRPLTEEKGMIERKGTLSKEHEQRILAETLRWAGAVVLSNTLDFDKLLDRILDQAGRVTAHDAISIMLIKGDLANVARWHGYRQFGAEASIASATFSIANIAVFKQVRQTGEPLAMPQVEPGDDWICQSGQDWIRSYACVPIKVDPFSIYGDINRRDESVIGFLNVASAVPGFFGQVDAERLQAFANQAAIALHNARQYQQVREEVVDRVRLLKKERNFLSAILDTAEALVVIFNARGRIIRFNRACERTSGYSFNEVRGKYLWDKLLVAEEIEMVKEYFERLRRGERPREYESSLVTKNGKHRVIAWSNTFLLDSQGQVEYIISTGIDVTQRKLAEEKLVHSAYHDTLTDLPNRALFMEHLERAIEQAEEDANYMFAVLFLDLDRFKVINDSLGHLAGDRLLVEIARRLELHVRIQDVVARLGGDEFAILLDDIDNIDDATGVADRIQNEVVQPIDLGDNPVYTSVSVGIAMSSVGYEWPQDILRDADTALYQAKARGRARYDVFNPGMHTEAVAVRQLEAELRRAVEAQEFQLQYQPVVSLATGRIVGVEALVRWQHPQQGLINPNRFVPLAEETGLIGPIGAWVLETACAQTCAWHKAGYTTLRVSVNVSPRQFQAQSTFAALPSRDRAALVKLVKETLEKTGLPANMLELEINESLAELGVESNVTLLNELRRMGIKIAIDDFGIGSSLKFLKHLPLDVLKIDQSFVKAMTREPGDAAFVTAVAAMAHSLKLRLVAEGVTTKEQLTFLQAQGCDEGQGFLFSKPLPADDLTKLLTLTSLIS